MSYTKRNFLIIIAALIIFIQIYHTIFNKVTWPFCSHNFYYHRSDLVKPVFRISLVDDIGNITTVDCRHTLPIEGYRCGSIYREVFVENNDLSRKISFAKLILTRLNNGGWHAFDERFKPILPQKDRTYVSLLIEKHYLDTRSYGKTGSLPTEKIEKIFTFNSEKEAHNESHF